MFKKAFLAYSVDFDLWQNRYLQVFPKKKTEFLISCFFPELQKQNCSKA
jgi:hypothetical protein